MPDLQLYQKKLYLINNVECGMSHARNPQVNFIENPELKIAKL